MLLYLFLMAILWTMSSVDTEVCKSVDVRNRAEFISEYRHCRVINGSLWVVLMENTEVTDFTGNNTFSELYEITEFLVVYRVGGLPSLNLIFPNLTVIKGEKLFRDYAVILYEVFDLEEIGLTSLQRVEHGGMRIDHCKKLCHVATINWTSIGISSVTLKKPANCEQERCPLHCKGFCWNNYECQTFEKQDCDSLCIGCTRDRSPDHCLACKYFNDNGTCVRSCSRNKLIDGESSTCVTTAECVAKKNFVLNGTCIKECPHFYERDASGKCVSTKTKLCQGTKIYTQETLEYLVGCTHINGSLDVLLQGYFHSKLFEQALGNVVHISGFLKISRSHALTTLTYFKKLKAIMGEKLWSRYYSLFVVENQNLQELFPNNSAVLIAKGEALFQNNPHLCPSEIDTLKVVNKTRFNNANYSCELTSFNITVVERNSTNVTITWSLSSNATLEAGYTVYYVRIPKDKFTLVQLKDVFFDSYGSPRDEHGWHNVFVRNNTATLKGLYPFSRYAYYIQSLLAPSKTNSRSPILYFTTPCDDPSEPEDVTSESQTETTVTLHWKYPRIPNGLLSHYNLTVYRQEDYPLLGQRNYCVHPYVHSNCSCPVKDQINVLLKDDSCIGPGEHYCNTKTVYDIDNPTNPSRSLRMKRSARPSDAIRDFIIGPNETSFMIKDLEPFTMYTFFMRACNTRDGDHLCGGAVMMFQRTLKRRGVDVVTDVTVGVRNGTVVVQWAKPQKPSSAVLAYIVEYKKAGTAASRVECRPSWQLGGGLSVTLGALGEGRYATRVLTVSSAAYGEASAWEYFEVAGGRGEGWGYVVVGVLGVVVVLGLGFAIWRKYQKARREEARNMLLRMSVGREQEENEWKLDDETVEIIKELGQNYVGILYRK